MAEDQTREIKSVRVRMYGTDQQYGEINGRKGFSQDPIGSSKVDPITIAPDVHLRRSVGQMTSTGNDHRSFMIQLYQ
jgi:hypothetical protein